MAITGTLPDRSLDECTSILGKTGTGKSYLAKGLVERILAAKKRVCVLDPTGVWWGLKSNAAGDGPGFQIAIFGGEHADLPITVEQAEPLAHLIATSNLPTVIDMSDFTTSERRRFATRFLDALYHKNREALHLIVDEADEFAPQKPGPDQTTLLNRMDQIVRRGRVKGFRVMLITQRPAVLNKDVLSMAALLIAMKLTSPQDRNAVSAYLEGQAEQAERKAITETSSVPAELPKQITRPPVQAATPVRPAASGDAPISPSSRKIIDIIHGVAPVSLTFAAAAARAGISKRSSQYRLYRKQVDECADIVEIEGRYRSLLTPVPTVGDGINPIEIWAAKLAPSWAAMLRAISLGPTPMTKDQVAERAGVSMTSSGLSGDLRELVDLDLIVRRPDGQYELSEALSA